MNRPPIVVIQGGLGNQLFQWFYAHGISHDSEFSLYAKFPEGPSTIVKRDFGLAPLIEGCTHYGPIFEETARPSRANLIPQILDRLWSTGPLSRSLQSLGYFQGDAPLGAKADASRRSRPVYVNGYFQKWEYAKDQERWIQLELLPVLQTLHKELSGKFDLSSPYTVIHARRGDYRADKNPSAWIGCLSDEYFIKWAKENPSSRVILLAEDASEVEGLVSAIQPTLVLDKTSTTVWETLAIMSSATTFLGSNSSLSWWGAWMASINGAATFLPSKWDISGRFNPTDFLFPECTPTNPIWESMPNSL